MKRALLIGMVLLASLSGQGVAQSGGEGLRVRITADGHTALGYLNGSATAEHLTENLPMTLPMQNLYGREMVYRFPDPLPTDNVNRTGYEVGEIIYWPPRHSLVIMYAQNGERFSMQKVGFIESDLSFFEGMGTVEVTIEAMDGE